jgi:hypothetical protein
MHPRRRRARFGLSLPQVLLVLVLLGIVFMIAYRFRPRYERSPFSFFRVGPGMSLRELRTTVAAAHGRLSCRPDFKNYQYCVLKYSPDPGFMAALLDPSDHVVLVEAVEVQGLDGLGIEAESAQAIWSRVAAASPAAPFAEFHDTGAVRWTSATGRWTAELHYAGISDRDAPTHVLLVDAKGVSSLARQSRDAKDWATRSGWIPTTSARAAVAYEQRRTERKSDYGAMATTLASLHDHEAGYWNVNHTFTRELAGMFIIGGTELRVLTANDSGWTAEARHPGFPGHSCVTYGGKVPAPEWPVTAGGTQITSAEGVACDPAPPFPTPSGVGGRD